MVLGIWLGANIGAQPLADWIGAHLAEIELHWIATGELMPFLTPQLVVGIAGAIVACWTDLRTGMIYNALTVPMMVLGVAINASIGDWTVGVLGLGVAAGIYIPLYYLKIQKGGDGKLWMALGALFGPWFLLEASAWYALLYIPAGLGILVLNGRLSNLFKVVKNDPDFKPTMLITGPVIVAAGAMAIATTWLETLFGWTP